ncbi:BatD family protein [Stenotrophomonas nitritireducens]|uniref:BatD family protein n=1 Tax=Stenotrophomonas nitritireducens TaxID=83617 RepID=UPI003D98381C
MNRRSVFLMAGLFWLLACAGAVHAQTRAWLDRDHVAEGEVVTLTIETDQTGAAPDYAPLQADFALGGRSSGRQARMANGRISSNAALFGVVLTPRRSGVLVVPPLQGGAARTAPLQLTVESRPRRWPAAPAMRWPSWKPRSTTRSPMCSRAWAWWCGCTSPPSWRPANWTWPRPRASRALQRVGEDRSSVREVGGRRYNVVERRFLLIPERSGPLRLEGARFSGGAASAACSTISSAGATARSLRARRTRPCRCVPCPTPRRSPGCR